MPAAESEPDGLNARPRAAKHPHPIAPSRTMRHLGKSVQNNRATSLSKRHFIPHQDIYAKLQALSSFIEGIDGSKKAFEFIFHFGLTTLITSASRAIKCLVWSDHLAAPCGRQESSHLHTEARIANLHNIHGLNFTPLEPVVTHIDRIIILLPQHLEDSYSTKG